MVDQLAENKSLKSFLANMGIHDDIAYFLLNRNVPLNNLYWKGQTSYLESKVRFLSIPFWLQICFQDGIPLSILLDNKNMDNLERILHHAEEEEEKLCSFDDCVNLCKSIAMKEGKFTNSIPIIIDLIQTHPAQKALRRGNFLIFHSLLVSESFYQALKLSKALIDMLVCGCIVDDLYDAKEDRITGEPNIMIELGDDLDAVNKVRKIYSESSENLYLFLPKIKEYLEHVFGMMITAYLFK